MNKSTENCMVCGLTLEYLEQAHEMTCIYCGHIEPGHIACPQGHYVCDTCHNLESMRIIEDITLATVLKDPFEIAEYMMEEPTLPMLGCQHAYIAAGALLAAIRNEGSRTISNDDIKEVFVRTGKQAIGGYCGLTGVCGITPAIGAVFAMLLGSKCGKVQEQEITMDAATKVSRAITNLTGPSCCKAYVRVSLGIAVDLLREKLQIDLPAGNLFNVTCSYVDKHPHGCRGEKCPYFGDYRRTIKEAIDSGAFYKANSC